MDDSTEFLTVEELAKQLRVSTRTIMRLAERREIKSLRVGRQIRFRREWVAEWVERNSAAPDSERECS